MELSKAQDTEAGDGTTSVVVIAGALLEACQRLLEKGLHPTAISDSFQAAAQKSREILEEIAQPVDLDDRATLLKSASTSLNSKVLPRRCAALPLGRGDGFFCACISSRFMCFPVVSRWYRSMPRRFVLLSSTLS